MLSQIGCNKTSRKEGDCLSGDRIIIICRKHGEWKTSEYRSGNHRYFETIAKMNVVAKLEKAYTNVKQSQKSLKKKK